ncbi:hypothetical protein [Arenimonas composti]|uniref:Uncharacterized protein n=1 Tax=Arenimonas composti TR7-09 = DSM 18010 TaxID=1121013 RepID=A0A091BZE0_9GAMM|nr:hypothetical protein [Arenimonas composti]KFN49735.1 hypothetical protein P873_09260 [Arenimonas composti TR7-09 = DSM 18010]
MHWLVVGGGIVLVVALVLLRRRLMDDAGPGRVSTVDPMPWDGSPRRASDREPERRDTGDRDAD